MSKIYAILTKEGEDYRLHEMLDIPEGGDRELEAHVQGLRAQGQRAQAYVNKGWADLDGECIMECRGIMEHLNLYPTFFRDGVQFMAAELLEFRRRYNHGQALDFAVAQQGVGWTYDPEVPVCQRCELTLDQHSIPTVKCPGFEAPVDKENQDALDSTD